MATQYLHYASKTTCYRRSIYYIIRMYFKARTSMTLDICLLAGDTVQGVSEGVL